MTNIKERVLILAPHTDDGEFGCGSTIAKFIAEQTTVFYAALSIAEDSVPPEYPRDILETEVKAATKELGICRENLLLYKYKVRHFAYHRQEILEDLVQLNKTIQPELVFMPCLHDLHQDHSIVAMEGLRAFKKSSILGYELPWNNMNFSTQCFVTFDEELLKIKTRALQCYKSQLSKDYASEEFIRSLARTRGTQIGKKYAEVFEVIRWIIC